MWNWFKRIFSVNPNWTDSLLSPHYRPKADSVSAIYERPSPAVTHQYHSRDTRRNLPPTISITTMSLLEAGKESRMDALRTGISPGPIFRMVESEEQSPCTGFFTLKNFK